MRKYLFNGKIILDFESLRRLLILELKKKIQIKLP